MKEKNLGAWPSTCTRQKQTTERQTDEHDHQHMAPFQHQTRSTHECHTQSHHDHYKSKTRKAKLHGVGTYYMWAVTALPYQHRISSRDLSMKKLGILRTEMIFTLPRRLLLRVMCPLHLEELDGLVARLALG